MQEKEILNPQQKSDEAFMLAVRMREGIAIHDLSPEQIAKVASYCQSGHLDVAKWHSGTLQLTPQGRLIADRIVRELVV